MKNIRARLLYELLGFHVVSSSAYKLKNAVAGERVIAIARGVKRSFIGRSGDGCCYLCIGRELTPLGLFLENALCKSRNPD